MEKIKIIVLFLIIFNSLGISLSANNTGHDKTHATFYANGKETDCKYALNKIGIKFKPGTDDKKIAAILQKHMIGKGNIKKSHGIVLADIDPDSHYDTINKLKAEDDVQNLVPFLDPASLNVCLNDRIIAKFQDNAGKKDRDELIKEFSLKVVKELYSNIVILALPEKSELDAVEISSMLNKRNNIIKSSIPDFTLKIHRDGYFNSPTSGYYSGCTNRYSSEGTGCMYSWGLWDIYADLGWMFSPHKGAGIPVAIMDGGVRGTHETLTGKIVDGINFSDFDVLDTGDYSDNCNHGTDVASIVAANINSITWADGGAWDSQSPMVGVAWNSQIMPIKIYNSDPAGSGGGIDIGGALSDFTSMTGDLFIAFAYASTNYARVINCSWSFGPTEYIWLISPTLWIWVETSDEYVSEGIAANEINNCVVVASVFCL